MLIASIAWGALAFGAVYPWAYWPLFAASAAIGVFGLLAPGASTAAVPALRPLLVSCACWIGAALIQLVPLPLQLVSRISPAAPNVIRALDPVAANGLTNVHPLSIWPASTLTGIAAFTAVALIALGSGRLFSVCGCRTAVNAILVVGGAIAVIGIVQAPMNSIEIYGFWTPAEAGVSPFGPFVNRDHFAGWMLLAIPLALGVICARVSKIAAASGRGIRNRILALASPDASWLALVCGATVIMMVSLMMTLSRAAVAALFLAVVIMLLLLIRRKQSTLTTIIAASIVVGIVCGVIGWINTKEIVDHFRDTNWGQLNNRKGAWEDAIGVARRFPFAGTGLNTYGKAMLFFQRHDLAFYYSEAHNDYLQIAAEGGALLGIPSIVLIIVFLRAAATCFAEDTSVTTYWIRAGAFTGLTAIAIQEVVDFSLQIPGDAVLCAVLCGIVLHRPPEHRVHHSTARSFRVH